MSHLKIMKNFLRFCLFVLKFYVPSTIFQLHREGSSWGEPVLSYDKCVLPKDHNAVTPVRLKPAASSYGKCSKILILVACQKGLDKKCRPSSDCFWRSSLIMVFPICFSVKYFVNSSPGNQHFIWEQKEKGVRNFRPFYCFIFQLNNPFLLSDWLL